MTEESKFPHITYTDANGLNKTVKLGQQELVDQFYRFAGYAVNQWAHIDRRVFECFHYALGATEQKAAIIYYAWLSAGHRRALANELITATCKPEIVEKWSSISKRMDSCSEIRNMLAHQPIFCKSEITNISDKDPINKFKIVNWLEVAYEEKELLRGRRKPKAVTVEEVVEHIKQINDILENLTDLSKSLANENTNPQQST